MIIGNGLLAKSFCSYDDNDVLIFASGVSNSLEDKAGEFDRERILLLQCLADFSDQRFVYFSTCSIYEPITQHSPYVCHKIEMEQIIIEKSKDYAIFRLPQVVGLGGNKSTLLNFLTTSITSQKHFEVWKGSSRNFIDVEDIVKIVKVILERSYLNSVVNIASPYNYKMLEVVKIVESELDLKGVYTVVEAGVSYNIPIAKMLNMYGSVDSIFGGSYLRKLLHKYYSELIK